MSIISSIISELLDDDDKYSRRNRVKSRNVRVEVVQRSPTFEERIVEFAEHGFLGIMMWLVGNMISQYMYQTVTEWFKKKLTTST